MNILDIYAGESIANPEKTETQGDLVFSLDIGTRSVVGIVGIAGDDGFEVLDFEQVFHGVNAMRDGQIEDIEMVSDVIKQVKETLERRNGVVFTRVAVAAAGRSLKTAKAFYEQDLDENKLIDKSMIHLLEYSAVNAAQDNFLNDKGMHQNDEIEENAYFCVGYSVVKYVLDGYTLANLEGHRGKHTCVDIIAAFLPRNVVRSIYTVVTKNGMEIDNLTLEPIAAINVIVPKEIRLLNIAIADIGAGTSDIAISKNGSIIAYGMVTVAGDEITESIMRSFLTDFETAERIKIGLSQNEDSISFEDILGNTYVKTRDEIFETIGTAMDSLCETISNNILELNETPPAAVFIVGGGSQVPGLCEKIAENLDIPIDRVVVGGTQPFKNITLCSPKIASPEFITPIGIGVVGSLYKSCNFFSIVINNSKIMILENENVTIMDALVAAGIRPSKLIGLTPRNIIFSLNGEQVIRKGTPPKMGTLTLNGVDSSIDAPIKQGDIIVAKPGKNGEAPVVRISDIAAEMPSYKIVIDGEESEIKHTFFIDGKQLDNDYIISEGDNITSMIPRTLRELLIYFGIIDENQMIFTINGEPAGKESPVKDGDIIHAQTAGPDYQKPFDTILNVCINGEWREIETYSDEPPIFADMLNYVNIDMDKQYGNLILRINGENASYTDKVRDKDTVEIYWDN